MDDMYPNDGSTFYTVSEPLEQKLARKRAKAEIEDMQLAIRGVIERLEARILFYDSTNCIEFDHKTHPAEFMNAYNAAQLTKQNLTQEKEYLQQYLKK